MRQTDLGEQCDKVLIDGLPRRMKDTLNQLVLAKMSPEALKVNITKILGTRRSKRTEFLPLAIEAYLFRVHGIKMEVRYP